MASPTNSMDGPLAKGVISEGHHSLGICKAGCFFGTCCPQPSTVIGILCQCTNLFGDKNVSVLLNVNFLLQKI